MKKILILAGFLAAAVQLASLSTAEGSPPVKPNEPAAAKQCCGKG